MLVLGFIIIKDQIVVFCYFTLIVPVGGLYRSGAAHQCLLCRHRESQCGGAGYALPPGTTEPRTSSHAPCARLCA